MDREEKDRGFRASAADNENSLETSSGQWGSKSGHETW